MLRLKEKLSGKNRAKYTLWQRQTLILKAMVAILMIIHNLKSVFSLENNIFYKGLFI